MVILRSYVKLPEGTSGEFLVLFFFSSDIHRTTTLHPSGFYFPLSLLPSVPINASGRLTAAFGQLSYGANNGTTLRSAMTNGGRYWGETSGHGSYFAEIRLDPAPRSNTFRWMIILYTRTILH